MRSKDATPPPGPRHEETTARCRGDGIRRGAAATMIGTPGARTADGAPATARGTAAIVGAAATAPAERNSRS